MAQSNFRPGYVLPTTGDTLRGEVDYRGSTRSARLCRFRPAGQTEVVEYQPAQLRGYGFPGSRHYESRTVATAAGAAAAPLFLERLVPGRAALYFLRDEAGQDYFYFAKGGGELQELRQTVEVVNENGRDYERKVQYYQATLNTAFDDCISVKATVSKVRLTAKDLTDVVRRYNACGTTGPVPLMGNNSRTRVGVVLGAAQTTLSFSGSTILADQSFSSGVAPVLGVGFYFPLNRLSEKLGLAIDLLYTREKFEEQSFRPKSATYGTEAQTRFTDAYLRLPIMLRYSLPQVKVEPFIQLGFSLGYAVQQEGEYRYRGSLAPYTYNKWSSVYGIKTAQSPTGVFIKQEFEQGLVASVGLGKLQVVGRPFAFELRAERSNGISASTGTGSGFTRFSALLNIGLRK
ncbi:hypothetical protein GCM10027048_28850 [Hymenobacter coalescens]